MNNKEKINDMTTEELARFIKQITQCRNCPAKANGCGWDCYNSIVTWLNDEEWRRI